MQWTIGVDEAGRGPLAGPVSVGVFAVPDSFDMKILAGIRDSKKLNERQREEWYRRLNDLHDTRSAVSLVNAHHIDTHGIMHAIRTATTQAFEELALNPENCTIFLDGGLYAPKAYTNQTTIIKGDATEPVISAGAILAKVTRDHYMIEQAKTYPEYGFEKHKGYGTKAHREAMAVHGLSKLHRASFCSHFATKHE